MRPSRGLMALLSGLWPGEATRSPEAIPASWTRYAQSAGGIVAAWLDEPSPAATRLRDGLDDLVGARGEAVLLPLSLWLAPNGTVGRVALPAGLAQEVGAAAQAVFEGRRLPVPPSGLRLPMRLQLRASPAGSRTEKGA